MRAPIGRGRGLRGEEPGKARRAVEHEFGTHRRPSAMSSLIEAFREPQQAAAISVEQSVDPLANQVRETIERSIPSANDKDTIDLRFSLALLELSSSLRRSVTHVAAAAAAS